LDRGLGGPQSRSGRGGENIIIIIIIIIIISDITMAKMSLFPT